MHSTNPLQKYSLSLQHSSYPTVLAIFWSWSENPLSSWVIKNTVSAAAECHQIPRQACGNITVCRYLPHSLGVALSDFWLLLKVWGDDYESKHFELIRDINTDTNDIHKRELLRIDSISGGNDGKHVFKVGEYFEWVDDGFFVVTQF